MEKTLDNNQVLNKEVNQRSVEAKQEGGKFTTVAQELGKTLDDYVRFTFSSEEFKKALEGKFGGNINQFNQNLVLFALTLKHMEKAAEGDEELKKLLPSLQEKMKAINENIGKIAKELGYTVSQYSLDKLMGKDLNGVKETLAKDFGVEPKLEALFSPQALTDLFASIVNKYYNNPSSVTVTGATVPTIKEKSAEEKEYKQTVLQQQQAQPVFKQLEKEHTKYHSPLFRTARIFAIIGAIGFGGGIFLIYESLVSLSMASYGLTGIGLFYLGVALLFVGAASWLAGKISEAIHNHHISKEEDEEKRKKKEEKRKKKEEERKKKEEEEKREAAKNIYTHW